MKKPDKQGADNASPEVDKESFSSSISGYPIPFFQGEGAPAVRWVTRVYGQRTVESSSGGKGGKGGGGKRVEYFGTLCAAFACDGVDTIEKILNNGRLVFSTDINRWTSSNPARVTLEGVGQADIYWGTESDPVDSLLNSYESHGPMKGVAKIVLRDVSFGKNGETVAPNLKIISRRSPRQTLITGPAEATDGHFTCNPITSAVEFLTSWNWGNLPNSKFVASTFQATADSFQAELVAGRPVSAIAPQIVERRSLRSIFADIEASTGAWIRRATDGRIECGRWERNPSSLSMTTFGFEDFTDFPTGSVEDVDDIENEFKVDFRNAEAFHKRDSVTFRNQAMIKRMKGRIKTKTFTRDDLILKDLASQAAREIARARSNPVLAREFRVRAGKCFTPDGRRIRPGDYFKAPISKPGRPLIIATFRCLRRTIKINSGEIVLQAEREVLSSVHPSLTPDPEPLQVSNAMAPIGAGRVVSLPPENELDAPSVCVLAARPTLMAVECEASYQNTGSDDYQVLGRTSFAFPLQLNASLGSGASTIQVKMRSSAIYRRDAHLLTSWTGGAQEARDDRLLLIVVKKGSGWAISSVPGTSRDWVEVMSVNGAPSLVAADTYNVSVLRGRKGTVALDFNTGTFPDVWANYEVWCVPEESLTRFYHQDFAGLVGTATAVNFRLTGISVSAQYSPSEAWDERQRLTAASLPLNDFGSQPDNSTFVPTIAFDFPYTYISAPAAPTGLTAQTGWGKGVTLKWNALSTAQVNEYRIYRSLSTDSPAYSNEIQIGTSPAAQFTDFAIGFGVTGRYRVKAEAINNDATDSGLSGFSSSVDATPSGAGDTTAPTTPSAMALSSYGTYVADNGEVLAYIDFTIPGRPAGAMVQNVLLSVGNDPAKAGIVATYTGTSAGTIRVDDLATGVDYLIGSVAVSSGGTQSAFVAATGGTSGIFNLTRTIRPSAPATFTVSVPTRSDGFPVVTAATGQVVWGTIVTVPAPPNKSIDRFECRWDFSAPDNDAISGTVVPINQKFAYLINLLPSPGGWVFGRFIDVFGNRSPWKQMDSAPGRAYVGDIVTEAKDNTKLSGLTVSQTTSGTPLKSVFPINTVLIAPSTATEQVFNVSISGFLWKPDSAVLQVASTFNTLARYDWDDAGNSASVAVVKITRTDGASIPSGTPFRITGDFKAH